MESKNNARGGEVEKNENRVQFARLNVDLCRLDFPDCQGVEDLLPKIRQAIVDIIGTPLWFESDVEVECTAHTGKCVCRGNKDHDEQEACCNCKHWMMHIPLARKLGTPRVDWGMCMNIDWRSESRGAFISYGGHSPFETRNDFYCSLFEAMK